MKIMKYALKNGASVKAVESKLGIGKNPTHVLRDNEDEVTTNMNSIVEPAEEFYRDLYSSPENQD